MRILNHDADRDNRCGVPEVVYGAGKSAEDLVEITRKVLSNCGRVIITRIDDSKAEKVKESVDKKKNILAHNIKGRVLTVKKNSFKNAERSCVIGILTAGTSDIPVAEEAAAIAEELGCTVIREYDVGIAGIHRVFSALERMGKVNAYIVAAGMEGALPSVVAGLVAPPVIAVPTSVGYGTAEHGKTALYTMLNSCTPLAVVNIDNGYGAAILAYKMASCNAIKK
jgi:pyridinium-3,5-biscarboxylic acid mononucleotide synthase